MALSDLSDELEAWLLGGEIEFYLEATPEKIGAANETLYARVGLSSRDDSPGEAMPVLSLPATRLSVLDESIGQPEASGRVRLRQFRSAGLVSQQNESFFEIANRGNLMDSWADGTYSWADCEVEIKVMVPGTDYATAAETLFAFKCHGQPTFSNDVNGCSNLRFNVKAALVNTNLPATTAIFGGTAGYAGGGAEWEGQRKPRLLGKVFNLRPVMADEANLRLVIDETSYDTLHKVYSLGFPFTGSGTDYSETAASGYFDLIAAPYRVITCDATAGGITKLGDIWERLLSDESITSVNSASVTTYKNTDFPYVGGIYLDPRNPISMEAALDWVTAPYGFWYNTQDGTELKIQLAKDPSGESAAAAFTDAEIVSINTRHAPPPVWRVAMGYQPLSYVYDSVETDGTAGEGARLTKPMQFQTDSDSSVQTNYPNALDVEVVTAMTDATEAGTVATNYLTLFKTKRYIHDVRISSGAFERWIGDYISLQSDGNPLLGSATNHLITGVMLDIQNRQFVLECWG